MRQASLTIGMTAVMGLSGGMVHAEKTDISDLVMYMVNNDEPNLLLRFAWDSDQVVIIGEIIDQNGNVVNDLECLTFIGDGPHKGFYAATNLDRKDRARLVKIDPLTAEAFTYPINIGAGYVVGMVAAAHPVTGEWSIFATHGAEGDPTNLIRIDPLTGGGDVIASLNGTYEGLALDGADRLFGIRRDFDNDDHGRLYRINPAAADPADIEVAVGPMMSWGKMEALEFAIGDLDIDIQTHGLVPGSWTKEGMLISYSDDLNQFLVVNPENGQTVAYDPPFDNLSLATDAEGLVFFTKRNDPFGAILANCFD